MTNIFTQFLTVGKQLLSISKQRNKGVGLGSGLVCIGLGLIQLQQEATPPQIPPRIA